MKYKIFTAIALVLAATFASLSLARPVSAVKCPPGSERNKNGTTDVEVSDISSVAQCSLPQSTDSLTGRVTTAINVVLGVLGIAVVIVIVIGGINFITSQGDAGKVAKAKNTILYGVIGSIIALLAYAIVNFVLKGIFGGNSASSSTGGTSLYLPSDDHNLS